MTHNADVAIIRDFLNRVSKRLTLIAATRGVAVALILIALLFLVRWSAPVATASTALISVLLLFLGTVFGVLFSAELRQQPALVVERMANCDNLLITADELIANPTRASSAIAQLVQRQAAATIRQLSVEALFPTRRAWASLAIGFAAIMVVLALRGARALTVAGARHGMRDNVADIERIDATVVSPSYAARPVQLVRNPARIEALVGSKIHLSIKAAAASITVETLVGKQTLATVDHATFTGDVAADADGFIALEPATSSGKAGTRKLIGLSVTPDHAPRVHLTAPGHDMLFPDANHALDLIADADDDLALSTLKLHYTKVSGSGERYTFSEGELPLQITRTSDTNWKARAHWDLRSLNLSSGDMVVYRAVATDKRPDAPTTESDSYIAEIRLDASDAAAGFSVDPEQERYALSQQMIIVKTEKLLAKKSLLSAQAFIDEANDIAAEQRRVRAEFVFMMGGELADIPGPQDDLTSLNEEKEAEGEADILDGRGANIGRIALVKAVRAMSGAVKLLNTTVVPEALGSERVALTQLERAFSHTRIILRALTQAERLDLSRRMTGPLLEAGRDAHPSATGDVNIRLVALRKALAEIAELAATSSVRQNASARASELAERVLRVDASSKSLQAISARLNEAAGMFGRGQNDEARRSLELAATSLTATVRNDVLVAPQPRQTFSNDRLNGALADALRGTRGLR